MNLKNIINKECIKVKTDAKNKEELLAEISQLAVKNSKLKKIPQDLILQKLKEREKIASTGFSEGIAIPHCSFDNLDDFVIGIITSKKGIDFNAMDKKKSYIFFFIIGASNKRNEHIQLLSSISRFLSDKNNIKEINNADKNEELFDIITKKYEFNEEKDIINKEKVLFHVFIQNEKYFNDILQIFSEEVAGSITVIDTINAGYYLNTLPIFSTFWTEESKKYSKIIIAVVEKKFSNNLIRKINTAVPDIENKSGVLLSVNELYYSSGKIDF